MTRLPFIALGIALCLLAQAAVTAVTPLPAQADTTPPEVKRMVELMASMPLNILVTETGSPPVTVPRVKPDVIATLIGDLQ
jgi:hypothetical protein